MKSSFEELQNDTGLVFVQSSKHRRLQIWDNESFHIIKKATKNIVILKKKFVYYPFEMSWLDWSSISKTVSARPPVFLTTGTWILVQSKRPREFELGEKCVDAIHGISSPTENSHTKVLVNNNLY